MRGAELTDEIDSADIDAQFERGRRHQDFELTTLEPLLRMQAQLLGEAAMMRRNLLFAEALGKRPRSSFGHSAGVDKNQGGAMRLDQLHQPIIDLAPDFRRHHGFERRRRKLERKIAGPMMTRIHDGAVLLSCSDANACDLVASLLG